MNFVVCFYLLSTDVLDMTLVEIGASRRRYDYSCGLIWQLMIYLVVDRV
ncbi:MAG: hypothetical protein N4A76_13060 [Firmicutes bacterium]|nr:hypothetical protein [Bacillota bacterium]